MIEPSFILLVWIGVAFSLFLVRENNKAIFKTLKRHNDILQRHNDILKEQQHVLDTLATGRHIPRKED